MPIWVFLHFLFSSKEPARERQTDGQTYWQDAQCDLWDGCIVTVTTHNTAAIVIHCLLL